MTVTEDTRLAEDAKNWVFVPAKDGIPAYHKYNQPIQKGSIDDREYCIIRLDNHLEATIVSDKDADKSAACMDVAVGYFQDPEDMQGTAHYCEHLMFMGSEKHPQENGYSEYFNLHTGYCNAWTGGSDTGFHFRVASDALKGALVLFSEFFYCPLFSEGSALREIEAVDSEYSNALQDDPWRLVYLLRSLARPGHPIRKFNHGSKKSILEKYLASEASPSQRNSDRDRHDRGSSTSSRNSANEGSLRKESTLMRTSSHGSDVHKHITSSTSKSLPTKQSAKDGQSHGRTPSRSSTQSTRSANRAHSESRSSDRSKASSVTLSRASSHRGRKGAEASDTMKVRRAAEKEAALRARDRLIKWWKKEYCAGRMSLAVVGKEPLDQLTRTVVKVFHPVQNRQQDPTPFASMKQPYGKQELGKIVYVKSIKETYNIIITFPIPWQDPFWREIPASFVAELLAHEGSGSLHAYLKNKGWLVTLTGGEASGDRGFSLFEIELELTKDGFKYQKEVILTCFKFINLLRKAKFPEWMVEELKLIRELSYRFREKGDAMSHANRIASFMKYPTPRALLLNGPALLWKWDEGLVNDILKKLDIGNCFIIVSATDHDHIHGETWRKERLGGAEYVERRFESGFISEARKDNDISELALPEPNPFLPDNLEVNKVRVSEPRKQPALIERTSLMEVWHKKDDRFWVPKAILQISARTPTATATPRALILTQMFIDLVKDALNEDVYCARVADFKYSLKSTIRGFGIEIEGYNDKLHVLSKAVVAKIKHLKIREDRFKVMAELTKKNLKNMQFKPPYKLSMRHFDYITEDREFSIEEKLTALKGITVEELSRHVTALLSHLKLVVLVTGNIGKEDALNIASTVRKTLLTKPVPDDRLPELRTRLLPKGCSYVWDLPVPNDKETNSSVYYYCHIGSVSDPHTRVTCCLLSQIMDEPAFNLLRTKEQLGYIVHSEDTENTESIGLYVIVQSETSPKYVESRIEAFLIHMRKTIREMSDEELMNHKESLRKSWAEKPKYLSMESGRFWSFIHDGSYDFRRRDDDTQLLHSVLLSDVRSMFEKHVDPSSNTRSKLSIHMHSKVPPKPPKVHIHPNVSIRASREFLGVLNETNISVDKDEYNSKCDLELIVPDMHNYLKETCLKNLLQSNSRKVKELLGKLDLLVEMYPVKSALEAKHIQDGGKLKHSLALSDVTKPVKTFKVE
ncbi:uncharacterized protein FOMMEDRAFT_160811 [Fomitiporia mediterranea MF3/22]|uniref:uncharacterized protein n=1 Tax=Fomitiporia mediterranea (strain MF3/22) TaxID=694068 RepID=UPI0004407291|nr:uncharacterized protein FOMMEDRAFT_160811 [Fomitiporia mediterranea MF3/22]EJC99225.1 hypothetical protein FOMMEDRAFT_160811 [Fomitiporia mediterranea MF3/22]